MTNYRLYKLQLSRSCGARGENLPCSLTQANSSLTLENAFIGEHDVGEADNKLNEKNIDSTENANDDDSDIPWSVEQSDREEKIKDQIRVNHKAIDKKSICSSRVAGGAMPQGIPS